MAGAVVVLHPACRVRKENFGLLFYDSRGPRLLFAKTGNMLPPELLRGQFVFDEILNKVPVSGREHLKRFLHSLIEKGYLREQ